MPLLLDAFELAPAKAVEYLRAKGMRISGAWTQVWKEQHTRVFTVANLFKMDLLQEMRNQIDSALAGELYTDTDGVTTTRGITFQQFKQRLVPRLKAAGWWGIEEILNMETGEVIERKLGSVARLRTIYATNVQQAYMAGRYAGQIDAKKDLPYGQYKTGYALQHTEKCGSLNGRIWPIDDPIWDTIWPMNHFGCTGHVVSLTANQADRMGGPDENDWEIVTRTETLGTGDNQRDVDVKGIHFSNGTKFYPDPGFDYNPGKSAFRPDLSKYDPDIATLREDA